MFTHARTIILLCSLFIGRTLYAQGDGPRAYLPFPTGVTGVNAKYLYLNQNLLPAGTILVDGADVTANVFPTTIFHTFAIKGSPAMVQFMINP